MCTCHTHTHTHNKKCSQTPVLFETLHSKSSLDLCEKYKALFHYNRLVEFSGLAALLRRQPHMQNAADRHSLVFKSRCLPHENCDPSNRLLLCLDATDLLKAKEHNQRLDEEILALRNRVRSLDSEKKLLGEMVSVL